jgi:hypothetical protein
MKIAPVVAENISCQIWAQMYTMLDAIMTYLAKYFESFAQLALLH